MNKISLTAMAVALFVAAWTFTGSATEIGRPTIYADAWGGAFQGLPPDPLLPEESGYTAGVAAGAYFDLGGRVGGALRLSYWEAWDEPGTFARRYTSLDSLLGPRWGPLQLLAGLSVLDRRDFWGEQWGGWGWRFGVSAEKVFSRVVVGGGLYVTPHILLRRWSGGFQLDPSEAAAAEEELFLVVPLGGAWALRGGYRGFQLGVKDSPLWRLEDGEGLFLGATARF